MGRRNHPRSNSKHCNPGKPTNRQSYDNQVARDLARDCGRKAREEVTRIRNRIFTLGSLHKDAFELARASKILADIDGTARFSVDDFCAYAEELSERLFRLELEIAQRVDSTSWRHKDQRLSNLDYALDLQASADSMCRIAPTFDFDLNPVGIVISFRGAQLRFPLEKESLQVCSVVMNALRKVVSNTQRLPIATVV